MDQQLSRYLNDHLAGSSGALLLIQEIADNYDSPEGRSFFLQLKELVQADRSMLEELLKRIDHHPSVVLKVAGSIAARVSSIKLMWEEIEPGKLGLFEALELLSLGVQGKCQLWVSLTQIAHCFPEWSDIDFPNLERQAALQRSGIEFWRVQTAMRTLVDEDRSTAKTNLSA